MDSAEHELLNFKKDYYITLKRISTQAYGLEYAAKELRVQAETAIKQFEAKEGLRPDKL